MKLLDPNGVVAAEKLWAISASIAADGDRINRAIQSVKFEAGTSAWLELEQYVIKRDGVVTIEIPDHFVVQVIHTPGQINAYRVCRPRFPSVYTSLFKALAMADRKIQVNSLKAMDKDGSPKSSWLRSISDMFRFCVWFR